MAEAAPARKILLCGDVGGSLHALYKRFETARRRLAPRGGRTQLRSLSTVKFGGRYALPLSAFVPGAVGAKSLNTRALRDRLAAGSLPDSVRLPLSCAVPFGAFEETLAERSNAEAAAALKKAIAAIKVSSQAEAEATLEACRAAVMRLEAPPKLRAELLAEMAAAGMPSLPDDDVRWAMAFEAIKEARSAPLPHRIATPLPHRTAVPPHHLCHRHRNSPAAS